MPYHILLVDDDPYFRSEFRELMEGVDVMTASNGHEAMAILKKPHNIDLIILDQMMPGMKGTETLKKIRKISTTIHTILLTGEGSKEVAVEGLRNDATDFIEKPLNKKKISKIKKLVLSAPGGESQQNYKGIQGKIERAKHFAERNYDKKLKLNDVANEVALSPKYFSRIFKELEGVSFTDYRIKIKIKKAKEMLKKGQTVEAISYNLGYQNPESFVKIFHKLTDSTPSDYREKSRKIERQAKSKVEKLNDKSSVVKEVKTLLEEKENLSKEKEAISTVLEKKENALNQLKKEVKEEKHFSELGRMASTVAHEIRHPLGVIQTAVWNIKKKSKSNKYNSNINSIEKMIKQCELVMNNLLDYSRIHTPILKKVKLNEFLQEAVQLAQKTFSQGGPKIEIDIDVAKNCQLNCDVIQIRQVVMNIIKNAKEALDENKSGRIKVYTQTKENFLILKITDNGKGIPKKDINNIFDPFFTKKACGTGLGLSVCYEIIKGHDGRIDVQSRVNHGTTFLIHLPLRS